MSVFHAEADINRWEEKGRLIAEAVEKLANWRASNFDGFDFAKDGSP
jgi:hypothetical protein